jgi:hypothetical protein
MSWRSNAGIVAWTMVTQRRAASKSIALAFLASSRLLAPERSRHR